MDVFLKTAGCDQCVLENAIPIRFRHQAAENPINSIQELIPFYV
jgi:hypothetical protein